MKEHIYKGNKIIEYEDGTFTAFFFPNFEEDDSNIDCKNFTSLEDAQHFLDDNGYSLE